MEQAPWVKEVAAILGETGAQGKGISAKELAWLGRQMPEVRPGETVVGQIDQELQWLFALIRRLERTAQKEYEKAEKLSGEEAERASGHSGRTVETAKLVSRIFWLLISERNQLWSKAHLTIRKDWKIVWLKDEGAEIVHAHHILFIH